MKSTIPFRLIPVVALLWTAGWGSLAEAQFGGIGDIIGREIERGIEREIGKIIPRPIPNPEPTPLPGPLPGPGDGGIIIDPIPSPSPSPSPRPRPRPRPNPDYGGGPVPSPAPAPPSNRIIQRVVPAENVSPRQIVLTDVLDRGPAVATLFTRWEANEIVRVLRGVGGDSQELNQVIEIAGNIADDRRPVSTETTGEMKQRVGQLRDAMTLLDRSDGVPASQLAILAQRAKNMNNMLVLGDLARLLGVQRRQDIFQVLASAMERAGAPDNVAVAITGFRISSIPVEPWDPSLPDPTVGLFHPRAMNQPINFVIDREITAALAPGELAWLDRPFEIAFDTGSGSTRRYTLSEGIYAWRLDGDRWDVGQRVKMRLMLDASRCPVPFNCVFDGERRTLAPGEVAETMINAPVRISYDPGNGSPVSNVFHGGEFEVGVNVETGGLDLIPIRSAAERGEPQTVEEVGQEIWEQSLRRSVLAPGPSNPVNPEDAEVEDLLRGLE